MSSTCPLSFFTLHQNSKGQATRNSPLYNCLFPGLRVQLDYSYGVIDVTHPRWAYCMLDLSVIHLSNLGARLCLERPKMNLMLLKQQF